MLLVQKTETETQRQRQRQTQPSQKTESERKRDTERDPSQDLLERCSFLNSAEDVVAEVPVDLKVPEPNSALTAKCGIMSTQYQIVHTKSFVCEFNLFVVEVLNRSGV